MTFQPHLPLIIDPILPANGQPLIIDSFAGGGGASTGIEMALGRSPDIAINHDAAALAMHAANHPETLHLNQNIWRVDPSEACAGRRVGLAWFSPDCTHHSKAKGGKPVSRCRRDLAWVVVLWAKRARPDVILLENVEEFRDWGPLTEDNRPCQVRKGKTFAKWVADLRRQGYRVEWKLLRACDYGVPTIRRRLFVAARCDGRPIVWPKPTHGDPRSEAVRRGRIQPWPTAASIIDWSLPCPSIFETSAEIMARWGIRAQRPLKPATLRRIARGIVKHVIDAQEPFLVTYAQQGGGNRPGSAPVHTITASAKDYNGIIVPTLVQTGYGEASGQAPRCLNLDKPIGTMVAGGTKHAVVAAFMAQHNAGPRMTRNAGRPMSEPVSTLTTTGTQQQVVATHLMNMHGANRSDRGADAPHPSICAGGQHGAIVAAFLDKYYGADQNQGAGEPLHTLTAKPRFSVVTVEIDGQTYAITDIGMRMLTPREQFRAQGFPDSYIIDRGADGRTLTKTEQTRMCGNSVCPPLAEALVRANCAHLVVQEERRIA
ncbi:DNA cytosine methyltransferase [Paracoccus sp. P2]|uniref:DNA (cytosine-5-)-methyltransferase n=2 Tax=Paracoccus pantotrophus TaxID=82367 RepID=A0A7H9BZY3_PARPN|nr:DNA cytosine methyltransferase [Paracoccus pantotrophus]QLH16408.1 DNA cytosine methyltransferase [Paracoccus pantotrophus]